MTFRTATAAASFRAGTEDRFAVHPLPDGGLVVVVADGAGGIPGGGAAADLLMRNLESSLLGYSRSVQSASVWEGILTVADPWVTREARGGETTAVVVAVYPDLLVGASCGDSFAWLIADDGRIDDLTSDQRRKLRIGSGRAVPVPFERPGSLGGTLLVASDGLTYAARETLAKIVAGREDLDAVAEALVKAVRTRSGSFVDDVALVLVRAKD